MRSANPCKDSLDCAPSLAIRCNWLSALKRGKISSTRVCSLCRLTLAIRSSHFSKTLKRTLRRTPHTEVMKAILAPPITKPIPAFISSTLALTPILRFDKPSCRPMNVPTTPRAVKNPGTAASIRLSVIPSARLELLKKWKES